MDDVKEHETLWAVIADNETPGDFADDIFVSFIHLNNSIGEKYYEIY